MPARARSHWQDVKARMARFRRPEKRARRDTQSAPLYRTARWRKLRKLVLARDGYICQACSKVGRTTLATDVDHIVPTSAGGDESEANLQALCHSCHSRKTAREDGAFGNPRKHEHRAAEPEEPT